VEAAEAASSCRRTLRGPPAAFVIGLIPTGVVPFLSFPFSSSRDLMELEEETDLQLGANPCQVQT
jgi:hypothetical protein